MSLDPKFEGSNAGRGYEFLRAIKIYHTPSLGGELKPSDPCPKILPHVKLTSKYEQSCLEGQIHHFLHQVPPDLLLLDFAGKTAREI